MHSNDAVWYLAAGVVAAILGVAVVLSGWILLAAILALGGAAWLISLPARKAVIVSTGLALAILFAVPIMRVSGEHTFLRIPVLASIVALAALALARSKARVSGRLLAALGGILATGTLANLRVDDPYQWSTLGMFGIIAATGLIFGAATVRMDAIRPVYACVVFLAAAEAALALFELQTVMEPLWRGGKVLPDGESVAMRSELIPGLLRAQGTFAHPLILASVLLVAVAITLGSDVFVGKAWMKWGVTALCTAGIAASGSRNAVILLALLFIALAGKRALRGLWARLVIYGVPLAVIAAILLYPQLSYVVTTGSWTHRIGSITALPEFAFGRDTLTMFIGDGTASTPRLLQAGLLFSNRFLAVDNQFVLILIQFGLIGFVLMCGILVAALSRSSRLTRILLALFVAQFFVFDVLAWPSVAVLLWIAVGLAFSTAPQSEEPMPTLSPRSAPMQRVS
ncbi:hypothetical protein ACH47B_13405 [Rhodococcus sp. NPDC019627]|uniref:hypothetical protein n=1 Tax=unclassified Rhodococcus (in: high G+C Gram-positive bacteria) TaxID=192944 RepID=UPI0033D94613